MDFTVFAIEAYWAESALINEYVQSGEGDVASLLAGLGYWPWQTREVLDLIEWMRVYNQTPGHTPLGFYGFDMQNAGGAIDRLIAYLDTVDPEAAVSARENLACFDRFQVYNFQQSQYAEQPAPTRQHCSRQLQSVYDGMLTNQGNYETVTSPDAFAFAMQTARVIQQAENMTAAADQSDLLPRDWFNARDEAMAENVLWLLDHIDPESKVPIGNTVGSVT
jgi:erythromycin esterase